MAWTPGQLLNLTKGVAQGLSYIKGGVAAGMSANAIYRGLRSAGLKARRQNVLEAVKAIKYAQTDPSVYLPSDGSGLPDTRLIPMAITRQTRSWRVIASVDVTDPFTGSTYRQHVTLDSSELMPIKEVWEIFDGLIETYIYETDMLVDSRIELISYSDNPIF